MKYTSNCRYNLGTSVFCYNSKVQYIWLLTPCEYLFTVVSIYLDNPDSSTMFQRRNEYSAQEEVACENQGEYRESTAGWGPGTCRILFSSFVFWFLYRYCSTAVPNTGNCFWILGLSSIRDSLLKMYAKKQLKRPKLATKRFWRKSIDQEWWNWWLLFKTTTYAKKWVFFTSIYICM